MNFNCDKLLLLGVGFISGSLALALRNCGWKGEVIGWEPQEPNLIKGRNLGVIDRYELDLDRVLASADVIVVGAPPMSSGGLLAEILPKIDALPSQPVVTDLASIKNWIVEHAASDYVNFVPGHPIAGSDHSGVDAAQAELFMGREVILTPQAHTSDKALEEITAMWQSIGSRVTCMPSVDHDLVLAASSHLPHMVAYALTMALADDSLDPMQHGGGALRDMTRIAGADPVMWRDIALANSSALVAAMDSMESQFAQLKALVMAADGDGMCDYFSYCQKVRRSYDAILNPSVSKLKISDAKQAWCK